jgi:two-component system cell cycle sensor histidine kinase/response regulator CckA
MSSKEIAGLMALIQEWRTRAERVRAAGTQPAPAPPARAATRPAAPAPEPRPGAPTILVVDDEDDARLVAREILELAGYNVLEARDGNEGVMVADWHDGTIDLVVTDVMMPYLDGAEFGDRIRALRPETKVLYVSGYASNALVDAERQGGTVAFLPKPFTADQLERRVRDLLGRTGDA